MCPNVYWVPSFRNNSSCLIGPGPDKVKTIEMWMSGSNQLSVMRPGLRTNQGQDDIGCQDKIRCHPDTGDPHVTSWHPADNWSTQSNPETWEPGPEYFQISSIPCVWQQLVAIKIFCSRLIIFPSCPAVCIIIKLVSNTYWHCLVPRTDQ